MVYTDYWEAHDQVGNFKQKTPRQGLKDTGQTSYIDCFNCTVRQRISRLVRKALSFSKILESYIGAIWIFIHQCNASLAPLLNV